MAEEFKKYIKTIQEANNSLLEGFSVPDNYSADGNGLPSNKIPSNKPAKLKRNIMTWFVPEFGLVRMYVNPSSVSYQHKKLINKSQTKGGFTLQYWGEDLSTLSIRGSTGSSGIEGINVLYEIYRAEQYAFDGTALTLAANNAAGNIANNLVGATGNILGNGINSIFGGSPSSSAGEIGGGLLSGIFGINSSNNNLSGKNIPSLAQLAFTVELYYDGWVYRGYFEDFDFTESAQNFLIEYNMKFVVTQRRGYRTNYFPWHRSAKDGPSESSTPHSLSGNVKAGR